MSAQSSRETREDEGNSTDTACDTSLTGNTTEWQERPAAAYPPGYPALCSDTDCFGSHIPDGVWNEDGTAEFDHNRVADTLVCSTQQGTRRRMHLPEGHEVDDVE
jgi:hypothetical protein